jgi:hypothetical protein
MPAQRRHALAVRLTAAELAAWDAACARSPYGERAAWARQAVLDATQRHERGSRPGRLPVVPAVPAERVEALTAACAILNEATAGSHRLGRVLVQAAAAGQAVAGLAGEIAGELEAARRAVPAEAGTGPRVPLTPGQR